MEENEIEIGIGTKEAATNTVQGMKRVGHGPASRNRHSEVVLEVRDVCPVVWGSTQVKVEEIPDGRERGEGVATRWRGGSSSSLPFGSSSLLTSGKNVGHDVGWEKAGWRRGSG